MPTRKVYGGKNYDWNYGRTRDDLKAEAKWKESKDRKERQEQDKRNKK